MLWEAAPGSGTIEFVIDSLTTAASGPYTGLKVATVTIKFPPCNEPDLVETTAEVVDHSGCIFDEEDMTGYTGWASRVVGLSLDAEADCDTLTPCHWGALNRCCGPDSGNYAAPCEPEGLEGYMPEGYMPEGYMPPGF